MLSLTTIDVFQSRTAVHTHSGLIEVGVIEPHTPTTRTYVVAMGFDGWLNGFELQRFRLLAEVMQARLVVPEIPGSSTVRSRMNALERAGLALSADFRPLARRMVQAAASLAPELLRTDATRHLGVIGYSLGTSIATAMAHEMHYQGRGADDLILVEPVAGVPWKRSQLLHALRVEDRLLKTAYTQSATIPGAVPPPRWRDGGQRPKRHLADRLLQANALCAGNLPAEITASHVQQLHLIYGENSRITTPGARTALAYGARAAGIDLAQHEFPGSHGLWHALPTVEQIAHTLQPDLTPAPA